MLQACKSATGKKGKVKPVAPAAESAPAEPVSAKAKLDIAVDDD